MGGQHFIHCCLCHACMETGRGWEQWRREGMKNSPYALRRSTYTAEGGGLHLSGPLPSPLPGRNTWDISWHAFLCPHTGVFLIWHPELVVGLSSSLQKKKEKHMLDVCLTYLFRHFSLPPLWSTWAHLWTLSPHCIRSMAASLTLG